jgi:hypothetical protein
MRRSAERTAQTSEQRMIRAGVRGNVAVVDLRAVTGHALSAAA